MMQHPLSPKKLVEKFKCISQLYPFIAQPCVLQAAMVVSETKERLSPNIEPPTTVPTQSATEKPEVCAMATAIGVISVIVPTEVPIAVEIKQLIRKSIQTASLGGVIESTK